MVVELCTAKDVPVLAKMNKELIEDEQSDNPMNLQELEERMRGFISKDYNAYCFLEQLRF